MGRFWIGLGLVVLWGCNEPPRTVVDAATANAPAASKPTVSGLAGVWRAVLHSPGGELPFALQINRTGAVYPAVAINGDEQAAFTHAKIDGNKLVLRIAWYDSQIEAEVSEDGKRLEGFWTKTVPEGHAKLPFSATRGRADRFALHPEAPGAKPTSLTDSWVVSFSDADGITPALAELKQRKNRVLGTFLTPTGDYRFLEGSVSGGVLELSCFDGAHAFLFRATIEPDGRLKGDFWSRDSYHATWTAHRRAPGEDPLPDPYALARLANKERRFAFSFPDTNGQIVSLSDERFDNKVVIVDLFGTWCPNCADQAPVLADWYDRHHDQGLEVVGLAFEHTGDAQRDRKMLDLYRKRHRIRFPLLIAGTSDKNKASAALEDLANVAAYPTTIFLGRDGRVRKIHSGWTGPGAGSHQQELVEEMETLIRELLAEGRSKRRARR